MPRRKTPKVTYILSYRRKGETDIPWYVSAYSATTSLDRINSLQECMTSLYPDLEFKVDTDD